MMFEWYIEKSDIEAVKSIVAQQWSHQFVIDRIDRNVNGILSEISDDEIWCTQMMCLLTSQQKSGENKPVSNLLSKNPFPLSYEKCKCANDVKSFINSVLTNFGGIRFSNRIPKFAAVNFEKLENGGWEELRKWRDNLRTQRDVPPNPSHYQLEREAARYMQKYEGFGPKQSRNFWQDLGLMRYEFVLDSRMTRFLKKMRFPIPLVNDALSDEAYYVFISDILRELCIKADVFPCVFDAAVFASYE